MSVTRSRGVIAFSLMIAGLIGGEISAAPDVCAPIPSGLVGWWRLEGDGSDQTGQHDGSVIGGGFAPGEVGQGYAPTAIGDGVEIPDHPALDPTTFTVDAWVLLETLDSVNVSIVWKGDPFGLAPTSPYALGVYGVNGGPPALAGLPFVTIGNGAQFQELDGSVLAPIGEFFHLGAAADGATLALYLNGQLIGSAPQSITVGPSGYPLQLGGVTVPNSVNPGPTVIDEVELHAVSAAEAEIRAIYEAGPAGKCVDPTPAVPSTWGKVKARYAP